MRGAAALLLAFTACAGEEPSQSIPGLIAVSGKAPWNSSCTGPAGSGEIFLNSEVEPSVAVDPTDPMHLIGAWQQDRWSNGAANGIVSAVTFDGGHTWSVKVAPFTRCSGGAYQRATDPWVSIAPDGTAYQITYAFDWDRVNRAMLVSRSDVREELDRLRAHIAQIGDLFERGEAIGRQLDFLCQELNREANTLCSKSASLELTRIGLSLKAAIEQFREQVQNLE